VRFFDEQIKRQGEGEVLYDLHQTRPYPRRLIRNIGAWDICRSFRRPAATAFPALLKCAFGV